MLQEGEWERRTGEEETGLSSFHFESSEFILATVMRNCTVNVIWDESSCDQSRGIQENSNWDTNTASFFFFPSQIIWVVWAFLLFLPMKK